MDNTFIREIWEYNRSMMGLESMLNLHHLMVQAILLQVPGAVVELGSYRGYTALLFQKSLDGLGEKRELHCFDSFQGLSTKAAEDRCTAESKMRPCDRLDNRKVKEGWFQTSREQFEATFAQFDCPLPRIHEGWFCDTLETGLPDRIAFAHLDADFYEATLEGLENIYPRLSPDGLLVLDDYCDPEAHGRQNSLPGVKAACDLFFSDKVESVHPLQSGPHQYQGFIRKGFTKH